MKLLALLAFLVTLPFFSSGVIPPGYYDAANGLTGAPLKTALFNIIKGHTAISYGSLYNAYEVTDDQNNAGLVLWDMYSNCNYSFASSNQCGTYNSECDCFNREHSFPSSWFNDQTPMYTDLFQVYPTDGYVNNRRGNYPFGETSSPTYTSVNGSKLGPCSYTGYAGTVFEPIDEYKGDFARTYFYMATRYENVISTWYANSPQADAVLMNNSYPVFETWFLNMLGDWSVQDPVSQKEIDRNNDIYTLFQHNRNPYIDHPEYVYQVWGVGTPPSLPEPTNFPTDFSAHNIHLQWADATGTNLPSGYLIRMSATGYATIAVPDDGIVVPDGPADKNIPYGTMNAWFNNLNPSTTYYFKIFGYTGSGSGINYKTDGVVPQLQQSTSP